MGPRQSKFYADFECATLLRNGMDHLHNNVRNLAARKGTQSPLFGALSYFWVEPHQITEIDGEAVVRAGTLVTITSGSVPDERPYLHSLILSLGL